MYAIGFMLITGKSYVELARGMRANVKRVFFLLQSRRAVAQRRTGAVSAVAEPDDTAYDPYDDNEEEDNDAVYIRESKRRKPLFFQLFKPETKRKSDEVAGSDESAEGGEPRSADHHSEIADEADLTGEADHSASAANEEEIPVIQSFEQPEPPAERVAAQEQPGIVSPPPAENEADADELTGERPEQPVQRKAEKPYRLPPLHLLSKPAASGRGNDQTDYKSTARKLEATLESFGVRAKVLAVVKGPSVTRYEVQPDIGVKVSRIVSLTDDIALALAAKDIRMEAPIPGKSAIGIEVPNNEVSVVTLREVMESGAFQDSPSKLSIALGRDISGQPIVGNLARMPHLLVAGATGSGKSVCINSIITSILFKAKPDEVKFLMIDPKMVELNVYNGIPHLMAPVVTDPKRASLALKKVVVEMEKRYELFSKSGTRNIEGYNSLMASNPANMLPYIVVIVDELADLMMVAANDVEDAIIRLAQMARAAGIHLIIATQRPSVDVITGVIKANIPSRIAFSVSSQVDSRTILDMAGAEKLLGRGDMLYMPVGASKPVRVQGANLSDKEVEAVTDFVRNQQQAEYQEDIVPQLEESSAEDEYVDELYDQAVQIVLEAKQASVSLLQRRMRIGYTRAARLIDAMEAKGVVGPYEGSKPREVLLTLEQYQQNRISS
jgi:S-DNA-T family DNA segregation ATPase FtsK/SpoIIIE